MARSNRDTDLELSITGVVDELQRAAEQARNSLSAIQSYVLENAGFKKEYTFEDLGRALRGIFARSALPPHHH